MITGPVRPGMEDPGFHPGPARFAAVPSDPGIQMAADCGIPNREELGSVIKDAILIASSRHSASNTAGLLDDSDRMTNPLQDLSCEQTTEACSND